MSLLTSGGAVARESPRLTASLASPLTTCLLVALAIAQQLVDVTDPSPPAAFLFLAPAATLARALGLAAESVVTGLTFFAAVLSIGFGAGVFGYGASRSREDWGLLLNASVFLLLVTPACVFAGREHVSRLLLAPMLATLATRAEGGRVPLALRVVAGLCAGLALGVEPVFALPLALPALALAGRERSPRLLVSGETAAAVALFLLLCALAILFFPAALPEATPATVDVQQPARESAARLLTTSASFNIAALVALALASARGFAHPPAAPRFVAPAAAIVCAFASAGFLATFFLRGTGWTSHAYPGMVLALLAWCFFVLDAHPRARAARNGRLFKFVFAPLFVAAPAMFGAGLRPADAEVVVEDRAMREWALRQAKTARVLDGNEGAGQAEGGRDRDAESAVTAIAGRATAT